MFNNDWTKLFVVLFVCSQPSVFFEKFAGDICHVTQTDKYTHN